MGKIRALERGEGSIVRSLQEGESSSFLTVPTTSTIPVPLVNTVFITHKLLTNYKQKSSVPLQPLTAAGSLICHLSEHTPCLDVREGPVLEMRQKSQ